MLCHAYHEWAESVTGKSHQDPERRDDDDDDEGDDEDDDGDGRRNSMSGKPQGSVPGLLDFEKSPGKFHALYTGLSSCPAVYVFCSSWTWPSASFLQPKPK